MNGSIWKLFKNYTENFCDNIEILNLFYVMFHNFLGKALDPAF